MPVVSVIVPIFNSARFLPEAVESVLGQTLSDWELLLADDGSKDDSLTIALGYASRHPAKVRVLTHPGNTNLGVSATRNLALRHSQGDYVAFLDSDDLWHHDKLERQVRVLESNPKVGMVYTKATCVDEMGHPITRPTSAYGICGGVGNGPPNEPFQAYEKCLYDTVFAPAMTVLARRDLIEAVGGFPLELGTQCEDIVVWTKIAHRAALYFIPESLASYRLHPGSWTSRQTALSVIDVHLVYLQRMVADEGMDRSIAGALDRLIDKYRQQHSLSWGIRAGRMLRIAAILRKHGGLGYIAARCLRAIGWRLVRPTRRLPGVTKRGSQEIAR